MYINTLFDRLQRHGVKMSVHDGALIFSNYTGSEALVSEAAKHKDEIKRLLEARQAEGRLKAALRRTR